VGFPPRKEGEWWNMGDVGRLTPDDSLELLDRVVEHQEETDSLLEKEDLLLDLLPEILELVLVPPDDGGQLAAVACLRAGEELPGDRFREAAAKAGLADLPLHLCRWEDLPLTASYKVRRGVLRARLGEASGGPALAGRG
jgi:fatty acid CoA ligase FadD22